MSLENLLGSRYATLFYREDNLMGLRAPRLFIGKQASPCGLDGSLRLGRLIYIALNVEVIRP